MSRSFSSLLWMIFSIGTLFSTAALATDEKIVFAYSEIQGLPVSTEVADDLLKRADFKLKTQIVQIFYQCLDVEFETLRIPGLIGNVYTGHNIYRKARFTCNRYPPF